MKRPHLHIKINNMSIGKKLMFSYMLVVFLPVLLVGFILNYSMRSIIVESAMREASVNVERTHSRLSEVMKIVMDISYKMQMDQELENLLLTDYGSTQEVFDTYFQYNEFKNIINLYSREIRDIRIYSNNPSLLENGQIMKLTYDIKESGWYHRISNADGRICWQYLSGAFGNNSNMCLTRVVRTLSSYRVLGVLIISLNEDYLNSFVKSEPYDTFFVDDLGYIFSAPDRTMNGVNIVDTQLSVVYGINEGTVDINYMEKPAKAIIKDFRPSVYNGPFKIISIVPVSVIEEQAGSSALLVVGIMTVSLLFAFILILIFSNAISRRIRMLSKDMHEVARGNFDIVHVIKGEDEIGQLFTDMIAMADSIRELVQEVYVTKTQKDQLALRQKEIKLEMLANQINPHFLFNTLETIRMKAHVNGQDELAEIVKLLGRIMRRNLEIGSEMITVESEIEFVKCYLEIQKFRYGNRINYIIHFEDEEIKKVRIFPLTIQPLVENAIVHGLEYKEGEGHVSIHLYRKNFYLYISVQDDGEGMSDDKLQEVLSTLDEMEDGPGKRVGLRNVHQRLKLYYGEEYGLRIYSHKDSGTRIDIMLPGE